MKRYISLILLLMLFTATLPAYFVVAELFTVTTCGTCPVARSALRQVYDNNDDYPNLIPIIWQGNGTYLSPNFGARSNLYSVSGVPVVRWDGTESILGGNENTYNQYVAQYNALVDNESPINLDLHFYLNHQQQLTLHAQTLLLDDLTTTNNKISFLLTYDLTDIMDPDYFASVVAYSEQNFSLSTAGQYQSYIHSFENSTWDLSRLKAVVIIQTHSDDKKILSAAIADIGDRFVADFYADITTGPPALFVRFFDESVSQQAIQNREWDFTGDGITNSTSENPVFLYEEPGSYTVTLRINNGVDWTEKTIENFIVVSSSDDVAGVVSGIWRNTYSPYRLTGDVRVLPYTSLQIEPGVEIIADGVSIDIEGLLDANAMHEAPIVFRSNTNWKGLRFTDSQMNSNLVNCIIRDANETAVDISFSRVNIVGTVFYQNNATNKPAALKIQNSSTVSLKNSIFANNISEEAVGGVEIISSNLSDLKNNLFVNNTGFISSAIDVKNNSNVSFSNTTIANNSTLSAVGFHIFNVNSIVELTNSIIRGSGYVTSNFSNSTTSITYSNVSGNYTGVGNIDEEPLFLFPSEDEGDGLEAVWYLAEGSSSVDSGNPDSSHNDLPREQMPDQARFPARGTIRNDMGAYGGPGIAYWEEIVLAAPHSLTALLTDDEVILEWSAPEQTENILGYFVYRNHQLLNPEHLIDSTFTDTTLEAGNHYTYLVTALYPAGESPASNTQTVSYLNADDLTEPLLETKLYQNYPNPFNPSTAISFTLAKRENVNLSIYNAAGQRIRVLLNETMDKGQYNLNWDGKDKRNNTVSSGVYYYILQTETTKLSGKMAVIK